MSAAIVANAWSPPAGGNEPLRIEVLSNRADLVSGGDALVEIVLPDTADASRLRATIGQRDVSEDFARRPNGRVMGLLTDLDEGDNELRVQVPGAEGARITITNHPIGGPVISGEQLQPWFCTTEEHALGEPVDDRCNAPTTYDFFYRSTSPIRPGLRPYDPDNPPSDVAMTTTDQGEQVPFIVRRERGTANRGIFDIAVLHDPSQPWEPWAPQRGWNRKIVYPYGASCGTEYTQGSPSGVLDQDKLGQGFAVANSSLNVLGDQCNTVISAEAAMMLRERIVEQYGEIRYTIGSGCSGGAIGQLMVANAYPGLVDGIQPNCSFEDNWTTGAEVVDCHLLLDYFANTSPHLWAVEQQRSAVTGHASTSACVAWEILFADRSDPGRGCGVPEEQRYHPDANPGGVRCTLPDYYAAVLGKRSEDGFARSPFDNVGWQYGLSALQSGLITAEQFVDLNEKVGGVDIDFNSAEERTTGDLSAIETLHRSGQVNDGRQLDRVPIIDLRGSSNFEIHTDYHSWSMKERLKKANGHADNHAVWSAHTPLVVPPSVADESFATLDRWLADIEADTGDDPLEVKVLRHRPQGAVDACYLGTRKVTDATACRAALPYFAAPRIAAGGPQTNDVLKCHLKPLDRAAYRVTFTDAQWGRLRTAFPDGVCDFGRPGVGQAPSTPWMTFAEGPGGQPLGPPPTSQPFGS
ncbi:MAG: hypothetical protein GEU81_03545 [Nitriliruptorales bacterium]|nr:hypothetical protein [Nitriliruptorales bacterium]